MRSQIVTASNRNFRFQPIVFTDRGAPIPSLRSQTAISKHYSLAKACGKHQRPARPVVEVSIWHLNHHGAGPLTYFHCVTDQSYFICKTPLF